jgi:Cupin-like domain
MRQASSTLKARPEASEESESAAVMTREWDTWVAENLMINVPVPAIEAVLDRNGLLSDEVRSAIKSLSSSHAIAAGRKMAARLAKQNALLDALITLEHRHLNTIPVETEISPTEFFEKYYETNRPVAMPYFARESLAVRTWSFEWLRQQLGNVEVEVMTDRSLDPVYEQRAHAHRRMVKFNVFLDSVQSGPSNDIYLVANNRLLDKQEAIPLWQHLPSQPGVLDFSLARGRVFLWIGPEGTRTPLHHDLVNILLIQIVGRKRVHLIPSKEIHKVYNNIGVFSDVDLDAVDESRFPLFPSSHIMEYMLEPGAALFIPVGWWHHVESLDPSISVSFTNFTSPNEYRWNI